ncbi:MAG: GNAT family N-acetyltransferase, partial [Bifidobacteriaceae bacterium]|nr:GNAT family N-acetyltransferase [Bifidobacteriaceae bacterium]
MEFFALAAPGLVLNQWRADDAAAVTEACHHPEIGRCTRVPSHYSLDDAAAFLAKVEEDWTNDRAYNWAIRRAAGGELVGSIGLKDVDLAAGTAEV